MPQATALGDQHAGINGVLQAVCLDQAEHWHQLLVNQRMGGEIAEIARQRRDEHLDLVGHLDARLAGQNGGWLTECFQVHDVVAAEHEPGQAFHLVGCEHLGAHPLELGHDSVVDLGVDDAGLLRGADHRRIKRLGDQDVDHGHAHVGAAVQVHRGVARPHADRRLSRTVGEGDDLGTTGRPDEIDAGVIEEVVGDAVIDVGDHLDGSRRQAGGFTRLAEDLGCPFGRAHGPRRRPEQDRVAGFGGDDGLEQHGRSRVGDGRDGHHDADGLGDPLQARLGVFIDDPDRLLAAQVVVEELRGDVVLDHFVFDDAEAGLLDRQQCQFDCVLEAGDDHGMHDAVDGGLIEIAKCLGGVARPRHNLVELGAAACGRPRRGRGRGRDVNDRHPSSGLRFRAAE